MKGLKMNFDQCEREYLEHLQGRQPMFPNATRKWREGDIDWSCYEDWITSIFNARDNGSAQRRQRLDAAIAKLAPIVSELLWLEAQDNVSNTESKAKRALEEMTLDKVSTRFR